AVTDEVLTLDDEAVVIAGGKGTAITVGRRCVAAVPGAAAQMKIAHIVIDAVAVHLCCQSEAGVIPDVARTQQITFHGFDIHRQGGSAGMACVVVCQVNTEYMVTVTEAVTQVQAIAGVLRWANTAFGKATVIG